MKATSPPFPACRCRFSQMLHPIFEEASNVVREEFPDTKQVVFARVDCDQHCEFYSPFQLCLFLLKHCQEKYQSTTYRCK